MSIQMQVSCILITEYSGIDCIPSCQLAMQLPYRDSYSIHADLHLNSIGNPFSTELSVSLFQTQSNENGLRPRFISAKFIRDCVSESELKLTGVHCFCTLETRVDLRLGPKAKNA